jgi:hypothetical protein
MHSFNTCLLHFIDDCVCFTLGNVVLEPFSADFQDQAFEESLLFFADQQGKLPSTYCAYSYFSLSIL